MTAIPIAAIDLDRILGSLQVRPAIGTETYDTVEGGIEHPAVGEIIFVDDRHRGHARRWANRQSGHSDRSVIQQAILVNLLNPKSSIFFLAFLPQFVRGDESRPTLLMLEFPFVSWR